MNEWLFSGIWWIDALRLFGIAFLALLLLGIPAWMLGSKLRWKRKDAADLERLQLKPPANTAAAEAGAER